MSVRTKVVVAVLVGLLISGSIGAWVIDRVYRDSIAMVAERELENSANAFRSLLEAESDALEIGAEVIAADPRVAPLVKAKDRDGLQSMSRDLYSELNRRHGITHLYFESTPADGGTVIVRVHRPELFGDRLDRITYQQAVVGGTASGLELGRTAFALRVVRAVPDGDGSVAGYIELGKEISHFLGDLKRAYGNEYSLVVAKSRLGPDAEKDWDQIRAVYPASGEWGADPENLLVDSTVGSRDVWTGDIGELAERGEVVDTRWEDDTAVATVAFPVDDAGGRRIGAVLAYIDVSDFYLRARQAQLQVLLGMTAIMVILGISLTWYLDRLVFKESVGPVDEAG